MMFSINDTFKRDFVVSVEVYEGFMEIFNDRNPLHNNEAFAVSKGFKDIVMHGNILNGFLSNFIGECLPFKNVIIHKQEIQYKNAVYLNDTLYLKAVVIDIFDSVNAVEFKFSFKNSDSKTVSVGKFQIGLLL
jgi:3-hydroxybutyryl-CoA dehydratase